MLNLLSRSLKFIFLNLLVIEVLSFFLILSSLVPNGISLMTSGVANKEFSNVHFADRDYNFAYKCWKSNVYFNKEGNRKYADNPNSYKIALLGDSMIENSQLSDGEDIGSLLQKKLGNKFEVTNFGIFSTGIYDHLQIYKKKILIKNFDLLIYFPDATDITDNHISRNRPNQNMFKIENNVVIKLEANEKWWTSYNSSYNKFKRNYLFYIKKYSSSYKVYWFLRDKFKDLNHDKTIENLSLNEKIKNLSEPMFLYKYFSESFINELKKNNQNFLIIPTLRTRLFENSKFEKFRHNYLLKTWNSPNLSDPHDSAILYMKKNNIYEHPFLSWKCDGHYNYEGANFMSTFVKDKILQVQ